MQTTDSITHFNYLIIKGVINMLTDKEGWRIVGIWGDEDKGEGMRIGPTFEHDDLDGCEKLADELEEKYGMPIKISDIISHFSGIHIGARLNTTDGDGVVERITPGPLPFLVKLDNGGLAWQNQSNIISIYYVQEQAHEAARNILENIAVGHTDEITTQSGHN